MMGIAAAATALLCMLVASANAPAQPAAESAALAAQVPIADVHFHLEAQFVPADIKALLDRNNVRWAGGVGPIGRGVGSDFRQGFTEALSERYISTLGQPEFGVLYFQRGARGTEDADTADFRALLERAEAEFKAGRLKGFGELFVNNRNSNPNPAFRRKIAADAPTMRAMYQLAARHGGFLAMHMEADRDSLQQLDALASVEPRATLILSHCGVWADAATMRAVLDKHPNIHCDLAWRSPPVARGPQLAVRAIFDDSGAKQDWLDLIEQKPDRFMIGTDAYCCDYSQAIDGFRKGLLARLSPATLRKVAYENAQRLMKLD
ncbi:MAG TPA: amidohydrolase family protein [Burkholderiales bacterium]|nr:amidohydrolase family protein [Burkholderiales bacterium]